jgi:hypothetical protein
MPKTSNGKKKKNKPNQENKVTPKAASNKVTKHDKTCSNN